MSIGREGQCASPVTHGNGVCATENLLLSYNGGTVENVAWTTAPQAGAIALLLAGAAWPGIRRTEITVVNETTLTAARRLAMAGNVPVALNFASATLPGGDFLDGALGQEESLTRSTGLYACLLGNPMYDFNNPRSGGVVTIGRPENRRCCCEAAERHRRRS